MSLLQTQTHTQTIPEEILQEIFLHCHEEHSTLRITSTPWQITRVCRSWRRIAAGTSQLWTEITLSDEATYLENLSDTDFAAFVTDILTIVATRTKGKATSVSLLPHSKAAIYPRPSYTRKTMLRTALQLLDPEMWQSLTLDMVPVYASDDHEHDFEWPVETGRLVNLECLRLQRGFEFNKAMAVMDLIGRLPKLNHLHFSDMPPRLSAELMSQLTHFSCENGHPYSPFFFVPAMGNLTWLSLSTDRLQTFGPLTLNRLRTLRVKGWPLGIDRFDLPSLCDLEIVTPDCTTFRKPSLRKLLPQLTSLSLRRFPPMDGTLVGVLEIIDGLQILELNDCVVGKHFLEALKSPTLAPRMRRLNISTSAIFPLSLYHELIRARGLTGTCTFGILSDGNWFKRGGKEYPRKSTPLPEDHVDLPSRLLLSDYYDALHAAAMRRDTNSDLRRGEYYSHVDHLPNVAQYVELLTQFEHYFLADIEQEDCEARANDILYVIVLETHQDIQAILSSAQVGDDKFWAERLKFRKTLSDLAEEQWDQHIVRYKSCWTYVEGDSEDEDESSGQSNDEESG